VKRFALILAAFATCAQAAEVTSIGGDLPGGGRWAAERPTNWNGTLLLFSRGYGSPPQVQTAPRGTREWLLDHGYAIAGANYSRPGWALEEAVPDQIATLREVSERFGRPRRVIAWGTSMGGLVTVALAERHPDRFAGALPSCGSIAGSIGMMNMALDGAFAFKTLLAPDSDIRLVNVDDDRANGERVRLALEAAQQSPGGRARIALAASLAGLPAWSDPARPEPLPADVREQQAQTARSFVFGIFFPRVDQERRAGGVFSGNDGVDYRVQLARSGRRAFVAALYREAGLDLDADLRRLNAAPRIAADPQAIAYMRDNYVPSGNLRIPVLSYHEIGDGATSPRLQAGYAEIVRRAGHAEMLRTAWVRRAGHCTFTLGEHVAALHALEARISTGRWSTGPIELNRDAGAVAPRSGQYIDHDPGPALRPCSASERICR